MESWFQLGQQTKMSFPIMPNLKFKRAASADEPTFLPPLSLANLLEEGGPRPCFRRATTKRHIYRSTDFLLRQIYMISVFFVSVTNTRQYLPWSVHWSQKNGLMLWSNATRFLATWFLRGKASWQDLPPELCKEIGIRLGSRLDILRFRSVCQKWRSSLPPPTRFPLRVPPPPNCDPKFHSFAYYITEVSAAKNELSYMLFEELDYGGKFRACFLYPIGLEFDFPMVSLMGSPKRPLSQLSFVSKAYHFRIAIPRFGSHKTRALGKWDISSNAFAEKMVIISSNADDGVNPSYARASDLSVVAHLSWGIMKGRLALLRLGGSPESWEWDTGFCTQVFEDIATYRGRLCVLDFLGRVLVMDYKSLQMTQIAPPSSIPREMKYKDLFEANGHLYLVDTTVERVEDIVGYKLSLQNKKWLEVGDIGKVMFALMPYLTITLDHEYM